MALFLLPWRYLFWHYVLAWADWWRLYREVVLFTARFFSLATLVRTLFAPWRRLGEAYPEHFDPNAFFAALIVNTLMRGVGVLIRLILLFVGSCALLLVILAGLISMVVWLALPVLVPILFIFGLGLLVKL
jgi:hypothetical protein